MSLIECPECGEENVLDSAESCPNCGYGIKSYFLNKKIQEQIDEDEKTRKEKNIGDLSSQIVVPTVKPFINSLLVLSIGSFVIGLSTLRNTISSHSSNLEPSFIIFLAICFLIYGFIGLKKSRKLYNKYSNNQAEYKKVLAIIMLDRKKDIIETVNCPKCGYSHIKIETRRASIYRGFLNIKVNHLCPKCKHKF